VRNLEKEILTVEEFYQEASAGKLFGLQCEVNHVTVPPRPSCRICGLTSLKKIELSGEGELISWTEVFVKSREFPVEVPYMLGLVLLKEGGSLMGVIVKGESEAKIKYGSDVTVGFRKISEKEWPRIFFTLV
jgi:uncharacterized protein